MRGAENEPNNSPVPGLREQLANRASESPTRPAARASDVHQPQSSEVVPWSPRARSVPRSISDYVQQVMFEQSQEVALRLEETTHEQEADGQKRRAISELVKEFNTKAKQGVSMDELVGLRDRAKALGIDVTSVETMIGVLQEQEASGHGERLGFEFPDNRELNDKRQKLVADFKGACEAERTLVGESQEVRAFKLRQDFNDYGTALEQGNQVQQLERELCQRITIA